MTAHLEDFMAYINSKLKIQPYQFLAYLIKQKMIKHYVRNIATDIPYIMLFYSEVFSSTNLRPNQDTLNETVFAESIV